MFKFCKHKMVWGCLCMSASLSLPIYAASDAAWLRFAQVCTPNNELCATQSNASAFASVSLNDLADIAYLSTDRDEPSDEIFSVAAPVYQELVQPSHDVSLSEISHAMASVQRDSESRKQLLQDIENASLSAGTLYTNGNELKHYYKEFKYLSALLEEQQRQSDIVAQIQTSDDRLAKLKAALERQCFDLDMSINFIKAKLEHDMHLDKKLIQYFQYKQRQHQGA